MIWNWAFNVSEVYLCIIFIVSTYVKILWSKRLIVWNLTALLQNLNTDNLITVTDIKVGTEFREVGDPTHKKKKQSIIFCLSFQS